MNNVCTDLSQVHWNDIKQRTEYFSRFFDEFFAAIKSQIDFHMEQYQIKQTKTSVLYDQVLEHAIQCNMLTQRYFPRQDILEQVR